MGVWSHLPLYKGEQLLGVPDFVIAKRSSLSKKLFDSPLAMITEAKKNDFDAGWGQCLAAMIAGQELNGSLQKPVYGGVTDGFVWRFGKLQERDFTVDPQVFSLHRLDELMSAVNFVLDLCKQQVLSPAEAA